MGCADAGVRALTASTPPANSETAALGARFGIQCDFPSVCCRAPDFWCARCTAETILHTRKTRRRRSPDDADLWMDLHLGALADVLPLKRAWSVDRPGSA